MLSEYHTMLRAPTSKETRLFQQAQTAMQQTNFNKAIKLLSQLHSSWKENPDVSYLLGIAHAQLNQLDKVKAVSREALEQSSNHMGLLINLATACYLTGELNDAITAFEKILELDPDNLAIADHYGRALINTGRATDAITFYEKALKKQNNNAELHASLGIAYVTAGDVTNGQKAFQQALDIDDRSINANLGMGNIYSQIGQLNRGIDHFNKILSIDKCVEPAYTGLATTYNLLGEFEKSLEIIEESKSFIRPGPALSGIEVTNLERSGRRDEAYELIKQLIDSGSLSASTLTSLSNICKHYDDCDRALALNDNFLSSPLTSVLDKILVRYATGQLLDKLGRYDEAFEHYRAANEAGRNSFTPGSNGSIQNNANMFTVDNLNALLDDVRQAFSRDTVTTLPRSTNQSSRPIFIVGMPRSGTTLTEQILSSHPDVFGAGELSGIGNIYNSIANHPGFGKNGPGEIFSRLDERSLNEYADHYLSQIAELSSEKRFVTDKMPQNFMFVGLISLLFPESRIIHCRRNPMDNALSIYFQNFSGYHYYATDLEDIGNYYLAYDRLMSHWKSVLDIPILDIQYEDLVEDQEKTSKKLLEFCQLEWDPSVLNFHNAERKVATASYDQVRQSMYKTSRERWKNYEQQLESLGRILSELDQD